MIEKNIFQSWYTKQLHPAIQEKNNFFRKMNPEYTYNLYTDDEIDKFVNSNFPGEISECYNKLNIIVAKVDFWRYLVLYKYGGVYLDMDSSIERPLNELIRDSDEAIITSEGNPQLFVQWALIFKSGHPILKRVIELVVDNIKNNKYPNDIHKMTGPFAFTCGVKNMHRDTFGVEIDDSSISNNTDITYSKNGLSYRWYGIDYNGAFNFKYNESHLLYINKKSWRIEQMEKPLLTK